MYYKSKKFYKTRKRYAKTHRVELRIKQRQYNRKLKEDIFNHYGIECAHCKFSDLRALSIDHINGGGTQHRKKFKSPYSFYIWLRQNKFPKGFQTLCMNCQFIKRHTNNESTRIK